MADRVGQQFGQYRLSRFLGQGSFGEVYLGEHISNHTLAAVKVLQARLTAEDLKEFINEASTTFRLQHPHIVRLLDFGISPTNTPFLVMAYASGGTLRKLYPKGTRLPLQSIVTYVSPIASALQHAHDQRLIHRDVWHVLYACQQVQARLDRQVERLKAQSVVVARQAARLGAGKRALGRHPKSDASAHAAEVAQAQYVADSLRYLSAELHRLLDVVVLAAQPPEEVLSSASRQSELETMLALLDELSGLAPRGMQHELVRLVTLLRAALPQLVLFALALDAPQASASQALGPSAIHLLGWAWQRRAILGPSRQALFAALPADWRPSAEPLLRAWEQAIRASSAVENWHSVLRPYLAVHRQLSTGMKASLSCWHNHRIAERGLHQGQSPLMRSGLTEVTSDWLLTLGYPPQEAVGLPLSGTDPHPLLALAA